MSGSGNEVDVGVDLYGRGDIDMWTAETRSIGHAVAGVGQDLESAISDLLGKITKTHEAISANITVKDEVSKNYWKQENEGLQPFVDGVNGFPRRIRWDAAGCLAAVDEYLANDDEMARRFREVTDSPAEPEYRA